MDFTFTEDQQLLADSVATFLRREVTPERIRASWEGEGSDTRLWQQLVELGLPAMLVPEDHGGLGMNELDFVLIAQECGRVALAGAGRGCLGETRRERRMCVALRCARSVPRQAGTVRYRVARCLARSMRAGKPNP